MTHLLANQRNEFLNMLEKRFHENQLRHKNITWSTVMEKFLTNDSKIWNLYQMEITGGEPDVIDFDKTTGIITFADCAIESPLGRRSLCYDQKALESRKQNKPLDSAISVASEMGIELMTEKQYYAFQMLGEFDLKTSSWIMTPADIREKGGALFGDKRFGRVFIYHNGAESYYGARGFRGILKI